MFGRKPKIPIDLVLGIRTEVTHTAANPHVNSSSHDVAAQYVEELTSCLHAAYEFAGKNRDLTMDAAKIKHDRVIKPNSYESGDLVLLTNPIVKEGQNAKLRHKWRGPYRVVEKVNDEGYIVRELDENMNFTPRSKNKRVHHNRLKRYFRGAPSRLDQSEGMETSGVVQSPPRPRPLVRIGRRHRSEVNTTDQDATQPHTYVFTSPRPATPSTCETRSPHCEFADQTDGPHEAPQNQVTELTSSQRYEILCQKRLLNNPNKKRTYTKRK